MRATAAEGVRATVAPLQESRPKVMRLVVTETVSRQKETALAARLESLRATAAAGLLEEPLRQGIR